MEIFSSGCTLCEAADEVKMWEDEISLLRNEAIRKFRLAAVPEVGG